MRGSRTPNLDGILRGFARGLAGLASFAPPAPSRMPPRRTVAEALAGDWEAIGGDMRRAIDVCVEHETKPGREG